jgi:sulfate permease, SulP family
VTLNDLKFYIDAGDPMTTDTAQLRSATTSASKPTFDTGVFIRDAQAAVLAALLIMAYTLSYSALMFPGVLAAGVPSALWAILLGAAVVGGLIALRTTLPPLASGLDIPQAATMVALTGTVCNEVLQSGGTAASAIAHALIVLSLSTLIFGVLLFAIGTFRLSHMVRLVPHGVVAGFLIATGCLLIMGGFKLAADRPLSMAALATPFTADVWPRFCVACGVFASLFALRFTTKSPFVLPAVMLVASLIVDVWLVRLNGSLSASNGWFLIGLDKARVWMPGQLWSSMPINSSLILSHAPDMLAIACIGLIAMIVKIVGIETVRAVDADMDREFQTTGLWNIVVAPFGGFATSIQPGF